MSALRDSFSRHHALQCGYCTPGMLMTAYDIVRRLPGADEARIREELGGNLCRCTGYFGIVEAIAAVLVDPPTLDGTVRAMSPPPPSLAGDFPAAAAERVEPRVERPSAAPGDAMAHRIALPVSAQALWAILHDIETVVRCLPGASLAGAIDDDALPFRLEVAIGPMRATFEGNARVGVRRRAAEPVSSRVRAATQRPARVAPESSSSRSWRTMRRRRR